MVETRHKASSVDVKALVVTFRSHILSVKEQTPSLRRRVGGFSTDPILLCAARLFPFE
jgi:hypothetical protein